MAGSKQAGRARTLSSSHQIDVVIERELREFLHGREVWPSYREFVGAGRRSLREAVSKRRGARYWAKRVGVRWVDRAPGYAPRWTEERVAEELAQFLAGREVWPPAGEFEAAGLVLLREAVKRLGGVEAWAARFGLARSNNLAGSTRVWNQQRLERAIGPLVRRLGRWPTKSEFREAGLASAQSAVYRYEGVDYWRSRFGLAAERPRPAARRRHWTDERIDRELLAYCAGRSDWPTQQEFIRDGRGSLYKQASLHGGVGGWQRKLGLKPPRRTYPGLRATGRGDGR